MKRSALFLVAFTILACSRGDAIDIPAGTDVTVQKRDGVTVAGQLVEVKPQHVVIQAADGARTTVPRAQITDLRARSAEGTAKPAPSSPTTGTDSSAAPANAAPSAPVAPASRAESTPGSVAVEPRYRDVTLPAGTVLPLTLRTAVASDTSNVEDQVRATLRRPVTVRGTQVLPEGTGVIGHVTNAKRAARVKGRGQVAFRFTRIDLPGEGGQMTIRTSSVSRVAPGTKKRDAATIGGGAVGGAIIGGIVGGGDGAAKGAAIGGAGGTGVVLATRGKEVRLAAGSPVSVRLTAPLTVRVRDRNP